MFAVLCLYVLLLLLLPFFGVINDDDDKWSHPMLD